MKIVTAVAGSSAFLLVVTRVKPYDEVLTAFIALWATLDIVFSPDKKADISRDLRDKFTDIGREIERSERTEEAYHRLKSERMRTEKGEMPEKRLIDIEARNDELRARSEPSDKQAPLSKWQRRLGYYITFGMPRLEAWQARRLEKQE